MRAPAPLMARPIHCGKANIGRGGVLTGPIASRREPTAYGREVGVVERAPRTVITQNEQSPATGHAHPRAPGSRGMCSNHQLCREMFGRRSLYLAFVWARAAEVRRVCAAACVHEKVRAHGGRPHRPRYLSAWLALVYACLALWVVQGGWVAGVRPSLFRRGLVLACHACPSPR